MRRGRRCIEFPVFVEQGHQRHADTAEQWTPPAHPATPGNPHAGFAHVSPVSCLWAGERPRVDSAWSGLLTGSCGLRPGLRRTVQAYDSSAIDRDVVVPRGVASAGLPPSADLREGPNMTPAQFKALEEPVQVCTTGLVVVRRAQNGYHRRL